MITFVVKNSEWNIKNPHLDLLIEMNEISATIDQNAINKEIICYLDLEDFIWLQRRIEKVGQLYNSENR